MKVILYKAMDDVCRRYWRGRELPTIYKAESSEKDFENTCDVLLFGNREQESQCTPEDRVPFLPNLNREPKRETRQGPFSTTALSNAPPNHQLSKIDRKCSKNCHFCAVCASSDVTPPYIFSGLP